MGGSPKTSTTDAQKRQERIAQAENIQAIQSDAALRTELLQRSIRPNRISIVTGQRVRRIAQRPPVQSGTNTTQRTQPLVGALIGPGTGRD